MRDMLMRALMNVTDRVGGPMTFRIILQPTMAALLDFRAGFKDAQGRETTVFLDNPHPS